MRQELMECHSSPMLNDSDETVSTIDIDVKGDSVFDQTSCDGLSVVAFDHIMESEQ